MFYIIDYHNLCCGEGSKNLLSKNIYLSIGSCFWLVCSIDVLTYTLGQSCQEQLTFETIKQYIAYLHLCLLPYTLVVPIKFCSQCSLKYLIITSLNTSQILLLAQLVLLHSCTLYRLGQFSWINFRMQNISKEKFRAYAKLCTLKLKIQDKCNFTALACNIP